MKISGNLLKKIQSSKKGILILAILIFNIPLAFGLVTRINAYYVSDGASYQRLGTTPSSENTFNILSKDTASATLNCDANIGVGWIFDIFRAFGTMLVGGDFTTPGCLEKTASSSSTPTTTPNPSPIPAPTPSPTGPGPSPTPTPSPIMYEYFQNQDGGILNLVNNVQATILDQRPLSSSYFIDQKIYALQNTGRVYAADTDPAPYFPAGTGTQLLQPIQAFWGWSVNIVFGFLILIIIGIAFAIIFRNSIDGGAIARMQTAIPSIALAMILVPLSYAISGVFIDAITVGTNLVHSFLLGPGSPGQQVYDKRNDAGIATTGCTDTTDNPCDRGLYVDDYRVDWFNIQKMIDISQPVSDAVQTIPDPTNPSVSLVNNFFVFDIVKTILNLFSGKAESSAFWFGEIINVVIGLTMIWIGIKILWKLFQKYLMLILTPIISPFIFATAAIPGTGTKNIVEYIKLMASGSLFYIVTYAMFILTIIFTSSAFQSQVPDIQSGAFVPPLLGFKGIFQSTGSIGSLPLTHFIFTLIGLGIYFSIPKTLEQIDAAMGVQNAIPKFIQTPIDSFRESAKITYRAAPAFGAKATKSITQNTSTMATGIWRGNLTRKDLIDRLRGRTPGQDGSYRYELTKRFANERFEIQNRLKAAQDVGDLNGIARANADLAVLNTRERALGINTQAEADKPRTISVKFDWRGSSVLSFDNSEIATFFTQAGLNPTGSYSPGASSVSVSVGRADAAPGKIILEAQNFEFPEFVSLSELSIGNTLTYSGGKEALDTKTLRTFITSSKGGKLTDIPPTDTGHPFGVIVGGASAKSSGIDSFQIMQGDIKSSRIPSKGNVIEIPVYVMIYDVVSMFGSYDREQNNYVGNATTGFIPQLTTAGELLTGKRAFKFSSYESGPFRIIIKRTGR